MDGFMYEVPARREDGALTADVPGNVSWVGQPDAAGETYLVLVDRPVPGRAPVTVADAARRRGLAKAALARWRARGRA